jgi:hypothetical protein
MTVPRVPPAYGQSEAAIAARDYVTLEELRRKIGA